MLRRSIADGLPEIDQSGATVEQPAAWTYVPPSHAKALDLDSAIVEGIRGAGKSFWWAALSSEKHRAFVANAFPELPIGKDVNILQGFGDAATSLDAPSKDVLLRLLRGRKRPRSIWRAVVAHQLGFRGSFPGRTGTSETIWADRTSWVDENPETFDSLLSAVDSSLAKSGKTALIVFDALDRLAETWDDIRPLAKGLLQVAQDMRSTRHIRLKLFVRPDMLEDKAIVGFPDASKLLARKATLSWRRVDLYALFFQCVGNSNFGGSLLRDLTLDVANLHWKKANGSWLTPVELRSDETTQETVFEKLAGRAMSASPTGLKRGKPYKWVASHLQDGRGQVSPRSFCEALRRAAEQTLIDFPGYAYPLHFKAIQAGVQAASSVRVNELIHEDYPWVDALMAPLKGELTVPCSPKDIGQIWQQKGVLKSIEANLRKSSNSVKLPPQHLVDGYEGVLMDLEELGLIQILRDGRVQMPDVFRIAFGLGRRGGVKPLK